MEDEKTKKETQIREAFSMWHKIIAVFPEELTPEFLSAYYDQTLEELYAAIDAGATEVPGTPFIQVKANPRGMIVMMWSTYAFNAIATLSINWEMPVKRSELFEVIVQLALFARLEELSFDGFEQTAALAANQNPPGKSWTEAVKAFKAAWPQTSDHKCAQEMNQKYP
jgi:hypothetical protein